LYQLVCTAGVSELIQTKKHLSVAKMALKW